MINLLPPQYKEDLTLARRSTILRKWIIASLIALVILIGIIAGGYLYLQRAINSQSNVLAAGQQSLQNQKIAETQKEIEELSNNTKLVVDVLSREILFSKLLRQIGSALPSNTTLEALQISDVQGGIQLNAEALDFNAATQLQVNLQDPKNGVFEKADINNITCGDNSNTEGESSNSQLYPCSVDIRALFGKNNSYNYLSQDKKQ